MIGIQKDGLDSWELLAQLGIDADSWQAWAIGGERLEKNRLGCCFLEHVQVGVRD